MARPRKKYPQVGVLTDRDPLGYRRKIGKLGLRQDFVFDLIFRLNPGFLIAKPDAAPDIAVGKTEFGLCARTDVIEGGHRAQTTDIARAAVF